MNHLMLDLETMGVNPGCVIVSIGAIQFDLETGKIGEKFYRSISIDSCTKSGLQIEPSTLSWWMEQDAEVRQKWLDDPEDLATALRYFALFFTQHGIEYIWGNSASFDCGILNACYNKIGQRSPWMHWNERCYRTLTKLFPSNHYKKDHCKAHDPIYDCEYQIKILCTTWKNITKKNFV